MEDAEKIRIGRFTSSNIYRLMGTEKVMMTYILEKKREQRLGREIGKEETARPLAWGKMGELFVNKHHLGLNYDKVSNKPKLHISGMFAGSEDVVAESPKDDLVGEIKCPWTRTSFCELVDIIEHQDVEYFKSEQPKHYWQIVSNSILTNRKHGEYIVFQPYDQEYEQIITLIEHIDDFEIQKELQWIIHANPDSLPFLPNESGYKNLNKFKFEIPEKDKILLLANVEKAFKILNPIDNYLQI